MSIMIPLLKIMSLKPRVFGILLLVGLGPGGWTLITINIFLFQGLTNGFSHLEWSATVPYNLAEEPDDVQGMKHSHSCHSMPGTR